MEVRYLISEKMNKQDLIEKLEDIEWEDFEVKEAQLEVPKSSWETVSAFSNTAGGWLVFGVREKRKDYELVGVDDPKKIERDFLSALRSEKFNHKLKVESKKFVINGKTILAFYIPKSEIKPVWFNSKVNTFIRTGSGDQRASDEEVNSMYRECAFSATKDGALTKFNFNQLDKKTIKDYRGYMKNFNPLHRYSKLSDKELLEKLHATIKGKVTIGGLLVFGNQDQISQIIGDFRIDYLEVPGTSFSNAEPRYTYRLSEETNLFRFYFSIIERLMKKIELPFELTKSGLATTNQPQSVAIREALVNLLMHTDYFSSMKPRIRFLSDRIEFMNPGPLPKDVKKIMQEDFTQPRNPTIARIFRAINLSENVGSGFYKMFTGWKNYYKTIPVVVNDIDYYKITFYFGAENQVQLTPPITPPITPPTELEQKIITVIESNPRISQTSIAKQLGIKRDTVREYMDRLKQKNILTRKGKAKTGYWEIKK